jgi:hypothetical protein
MCFYRKQSLRNLYANGLICCSNKESKNTTPKEFNYEEINIALLSFGRFARLSGIRFRDEFPG